MAKRKSLANELISDRYFIWAVVMAVIVGLGLVAQISIAGIQMDTETSSQSFLINHGVQNKH